MTNAFFGISAAGTLSGLVNIETLTEFAPTTLGDNLLVSLTGKVKRGTSAGTGRADGFIDGALAFDIMRWTAFRAFMYSVFGGFNVASKSAAFTLITTDKFYTPFIGKIKEPTFTPVNDVWIKDVRFPLSALVLQASTKITTYTITASDRLVKGDTTSGNFTLTMPAANAVQADTIVSVQKIASANTLTIQRAGSDTVNAGTSVALTANYSRYDFYSDGVSAWVSV